MENNMENTDTDTVNILKQSPIIIEETKPQNEALLDLLDGHQAANIIKEWTKVMIGGKIGYIKNLNIGEFVARDQWISAHQFLGQIPNENGKMTYISNWFDSKARYFQVIVDQSQKHGIDHNKHTLNICLNGRENDIMPDCGDIKAGEKAWLDFLNTLPINKNSFPAIELWAAQTATTNQQNRLLLCLKGIQGTGKSTFADLIKELVNGSTSTFQLDARFNSQIVGKRLLCLSETVEKLSPAQWTQIKKITGEKELEIEKKGVDLFTVKQNSAMIMTTNAENPIPENDKQYGKGSTRVLIVNFNNNRADSNQFKEAKRAFIEHKKDILAYLANSLKVENQCNDENDYINLMSGFVNNELIEMRVAAMSTPEQILIEDIDNNTKEIRDLEIIKKNQTNIQLKDLWELYKTHSAFLGLKPSTGKQYITNAFEARGWTITLDRDKMKTLTKDKQQR